MGGALAELLLKEGYSVALVTPEPEVSSWTHMTLEQHRIQAHLLDLGAEVVVAHSVIGATASGLVTQSVYTGSEQAIECHSAVFVTSRLPNETISLETVYRRVGFDVSMSPNTSVIPTSGAGANSTWSDFGT